MTQQELIETIRTLPVQSLLPLQEAIEQRLLSLSEEEAAELLNESHLTYEPTLEQSAELDRMIAAHEKGELNFISRKEFMARMRKRRDL